MRRTLRALVGAFALVALATSNVWAVEICSNSIDDDGDGMTDEDCQPSEVSQVCESPLSCMETGMVSWSSGALRYDLPPDVAPKVPYGPSIGFKRHYVSMAAPGSNPTSVNKTPFGGDGRWQHTYLTYVYRYTGGDGVPRIILHTNTGRDVLFTRSATGSWETYTPQAGFHVMSMKWNTASPNQFQMQLLTGEMLVFNSVGQISEIWDNLQPTPNKVMITWTSTSNGNVSTVTDANGKRRLSFSYTSNNLTSIMYESNVSGTWVGRHQTTFDYTVAGVSRDATSGWYVPANASEWTTLLSGTGFSNPTSLWLLQETSGTLADSIGSATGTATGTLNYQQTASGWSRKGVKFATDGDNAKIQVATPNASSNSLMLAQVFSLNTNPASGYRALNNLGTSYFESAQLVNGPKVRAQSGGNTATTAGNYAGTVLVVTKYDRTNSVMAVYTDSGDILKPTFQAQSPDTASYILGDNTSSSNATLLYSTLFSGTAAELTDAKVAVLMNRLKKGPGLTSVTIGGQLAQKMVYDGTGLLSKVTDASGNQIATFGYSSTTAGQVNAITTPRGTVGFEFSSSRTGCTGKTALYFNKGSAASCSVDGDCGAGMMCGGKTGSGSTGQCFLAARCLTLSTSYGESVVTNVDPIGPGGGSCSGACTDVAQYVWNTTTANVIRAIGVKDPLGNYTSASFNANGLPTQISYGDTNSDPTSGYQRTVYLFYDSTFPGRLSEIRRKSDLSASAGSCSASVSTGCARTRYLFHATSKLLETLEEIGTTLDSSGTKVNFTAQTVYTRDSKGRVTQITGPVSPMKSVFAFNTSSDPDQDGFLANVKLYKDATNYLQPTVFAYDYWGNPTGVTAPDGTVSCQVFDSARGFLSSRREPMNGQTDCVTSNAADLTTTWARDSALRVTQLTRPDGSCMHWEYDSAGRLATTKRRDDCNAGSSGDREDYLYNSEGLLYEIDTKDAGGTIKRKQLMSYWASRRLAAITNPVDITKSTNLLYDAAGMVNQIDHAGSLGKTTFTINADRRVTAETRYKDATNSDTWQLLYDWLGSQAKVTDADSKATETVRDDLGRIVKLISPDTSYPTLRVYDNASRLTTVKQAFGGGASEQTHTFTFDALSRPLDDNFHGTCPTTGTAHAEIIRVYDSATGCPGTCSALTGKLAKVTASLLCSSTYSATDGSLDQATWMSYDAGDRSVAEYTSDDSGRTANETFAWTKNGALQQVNTPAGVELIYSFGSAGSNSDTDRVTKISRVSTGIPVIEDVTWFPYGPLAGYKWEATQGGNALTTSISRNVAYRPTYVGNGVYSGSSVLFGVTLDEDAKGRVVDRKYSSTPGSGTSGVTDSYFLYDHQDRVTCETTTYQTSCPTSGAGLKNNLSGFTGAGDWQTLYRPIPGSTGFTNTFNPSGYGTSHQVTMVRQNAGTPALGDTVLAYDARGNRTSDDNTSTLSHDWRGYTYDGRGNVINVRGQYWSTSAIPNQWAMYDVISGFDAKNRRVYKAFYDETTLKMATWFFYYDPHDRLIEVRYTPDISASSTYQVIQMFWLGDRLTAYWQTDYPSTTTSKRYVATDEMARPLGLWTWPTSGNPERAWAINPSAWGVDNNLAGSTLFQPVLFRGQFWDLESVSLADDHMTSHRPGVVLNGFRSYDPSTGTYLEVDPYAGFTWDSYLYASSNPVGRSDPDGLWDGSAWDAEGEMITIEDPYFGVDPCGGNGFGSWGVWCEPHSDGPYWGWPGGSGGGGGGGGTPPQCGIWCVLHEAIHALKPSSGVQADEDTTKEIQCTNAILQKQKLECDRCISDWAQRETNYQGVDSLTEDCGFNVFTYKLKPCSQCDPCDRFSPWHNTPNCQLAMTSNRFQKM